MMNSFFRTIITLAIAIFAYGLPDATACTGIALKAKDGSHIIARTMEWGGFYMKSKYVIVPRGFTQTAETPTGADGFKFKSKYGYVGISALEDHYIAEGMNEKGLVAELFYFPGHGKYETYDPKNHDNTIVDLQLIPWLLSQFETVDQFVEGLKGIHIMPYGHGFGYAHWSIADHTGREIVLELIDEKPVIYENKVGIITNAPEFTWHITNLNNYVNINAGGAPNRTIADGVTLKSFGVGSAGWGLPGDLTPPSRFVRAAFYKYTSRPQETGHRTAIQAFQILNNFDIPIGAEFTDPNQSTDLLSATQWTTASDTKNLKFYYRTEWNSMIRCIDLKTINFSKVSYQVGKLDRSLDQPIEYIHVK